MYIYTSLCIYICISCLIHHLLFLSIRCFTDEESYCSLWNCFFQMGCGAGLLHLHAVQDVVLWDFFLLQEQWQDSLSLGRSPEVKQSQAHLKLNDKMNHQNGPYTISH